MHACALGHAMHSLQKLMSPFFPLSSLQEWQPDTLTWEWPSNPTEFSECRWGWVQAQVLSWRGAASHQSLSLHASPICFPFLSETDLPLCPALPRPAPPRPAAAAASGKAQPPAADVQKLTSAICSDPEAAGEQIRTAVQAGGAQAQAAVYAIFAADCPDEAAAGDAYGGLVLGGYGDEIGVERGGWLVSSGGVVIIADQVHPTMVTFLFRLKHGCAPCPPSLQVLPSTQ